MTPSDNYDAQHVAHEHLGATYNLFALTGSRPDPIVTTVCVDGKPMTMKIDTGATLSIISEETWNQHWSTPRPCLQGTRDTLRTYTGQCVKITGIADVTVVAKTGSKHVLPLMVVPGNGPSLLGRNLLSTLQLEWFAVHRMSTTSLTRYPQLRALLKKHSAGFSDTHQAIKTNVAKIYVDDNAVPKYFKARPLPYVMRDMVDKERDRLLTEDIIEPVQYSSWDAPVVPVMKADTTVRLCGDYKLTVNQVTKLDRYPLPRIEDLYASLVTAQPIQSWTCAMRMNRSNFIRTVGSMLQLTHLEGFSHTSDCHTESRRPLVFSRE